jgi:hypothetical protein
MGRNVSFVTFSKIRTQPLSRSTKTLIIVSNFRISIDVLHANFLFVD